MDGSAPFLPLICNVSCLVCFLIVVCLPLPMKLNHAVMISSGSCVLLLAQQDGYFIPRTSGLFLPPSLFLSSLTLFLISLYTSLQDLNTGVTTSQFSQYTICYYNDALISWIMKLTSFFWFLLLFPLPTSLEDTYIHWMIMTLLSTVRLY